MCMYTLILISVVTFKILSPISFACTDGPGCENLQFCSATYRLMKVVPSTGGKEQNGSKASEKKCVPIRYKGWFAITNELARFRPLWFSWVRVVLIVALSCCIRKCLLDC